MKTKPYKSKSPVSYMASILTVGEMMEVTDADNPSVIGHVLLRTYDQIISLTDPSHTWTNIHSCSIEGRKLLPGEGITLIQE